MGCMNELDENGVCQYCSYTDDIPHLQSYLAPRTVLDDRYIVGKMLSYNGEGASYICYDMIRKCKAVVTQNIDGLHQKAGSEIVFELHGSVLRNFCTKCGKFFDEKFTYYTKFVS